MTEIKERNKSPLTYDFFTWLGKSGDGCRPCAKLVGVYGLLAWVHTCLSVGYWSGRIPAGCCGFPLTDWMVAGAPAY